MLCLHADAVACVRYLAGGGRVHLKDGQARPRQVPLRGHRHLHRQEAGGSAAVLSQL